MRVDERIGNLITLQSMIDALREGLPGLALGLLASVRVRRVAESLTGVDRLHLVDKRWFFARPARWFRTVRALRREAYQVCIDASAWHVFSFTHAALSYYSGAPVRIGYRREVGGAFHSVQVDPGPAREHELKQRMRLLAPLGIDADPPQLRTGLGLEGVEGWRGWLEDLRLGALRIGLWPGARKLERRWPVPFFVQLARKLQQRQGADLVVLWGPGEEELRDHVASAIREGVVTAPRTDLDELAGLMRCLDLVIVNDTGPMHLAVAVGTPTLALFASGDPRRWCHPYPHVRSLAAPGADPREVEQAAAAAARLLGRTR